MESQYWTFLQEAEKTRLFWLHDHFTNKVSPFSQHKQREGTWKVSQTDLTAPIKAELELVIRLYTLNVWCSSSCHDGLLIFMAFQKLQCPNTAVMKLSAKCLFTKRMHWALWNHWFSQCTWPICKGIMMKRKIQDMSLQMKYFSNSRPSLVAGKFCSPLENEAEKGNWYFEWETWCSPKYSERISYGFIWDIKPLVIWGSTLFRQTTTLKLLQ